MLCLEMCFTWNVHIFFCLLHLYNENVFNSLTLQDYNQGLGHSELSEPLKKIL